jgi:uncharacterized protein (UPF0179 family)
MTRLGADNKSVVFRVQVAKQALAVVMVRHEQLIELGEKESAYAGSVVTTRFGTCTREENEVSILKWGDRVMSDRQKVERQLQGASDEEKPLIEEELRLVLQQIERTGAARMCSLLGCC